MGIKDFFFGNKPENKKQNLLTGGQGNFLDMMMQQLSQMGGQGGGMGNAMNILQQYLDPNSEIYKNFEQPYINEFNQQTIPGIAERFAGAGGGMGGGLSSSGFGQSLGAAGANLQAQLASMKSGMQKDAVGSMFNQYNQMANQGLGTRSFENQYFPGTGGLVGNIAQGVGAGIGTGGGMGLASYAGKRFFGG